MVTAFWSVQHVPNIYLLKITLFYDFTILGALTYISWLTNIIIISRYKQGIYHFLHPNSVQPIILKSILYI